MLTSWSGNRASRAGNRSSQQERLALVRNDTVLDRSTNVLFEVFMVPGQGLKLQDHRSAYLLKRMASSPNESPELIAVDDWTVERSGRYVRTAPTGKSTEGE